MNDEVKYIGVIDEAQNTPKNIKPEKSKRFKTNKSSVKVNKFIASTKKSIFNKKFLTIAAIIVLLYFFNPITFLRNALDQKRDYYAYLREEQAKEREANGQSSNFFTNALDAGKIYASTYIDSLSAFDYTFGKDYYKNCKNTMVWPVDGTMNYHYDLSHRGIDIVANDYPGNVYAAANGTVVYVGYSEKYGNELMIQHNINGMTLYTFYGNLSLITISQGQYVAQNQVIGKEAGNPTNPKNLYDPNQHHIHFEVRQANQKTQLKPGIFLQK